MTEIVSTPGSLGGKPRVKGTRVSVEAVWELHQEGLTVEEIAEELPTVSLEVIDAALDYGEKYIETT